MHWGRGPPQRTTTPFTIHATRLNYSFLVELELELDELLLAVSYVNSGIAFS